VRGGAPLCTDMATHSLTGVSALLALLSSLLWGSADFLGGILSRRLPAVLVVACSQVAGLFAVLAAAVVAGALDAPTGYLPWALAAGVTGVIGLVSFYAALASGTMGVVSPIAALGVVVPVVVGFAQGERPGAVQVVGIVVAIAGVVLASGPELSGKAGVRPLVLAVVAAFGFGLALLFIAKGSRDSTLMTLLAMRVTSVTVLGLALGAMALRARRAGAPRGPRLEPRDFALLAAVGVADAAANLTFGWSSTRGLVSVAAVLGSLYPVVTVLLARVVLNERLGRAQTVGVAGALAGVVLIGAG
jgi:drug/metabolite transporter (DMT)-like permease